MLSVFQLIVLVLPAVLDLVCWCQFNRNGMTERQQTGNTDTDRNYVLNILEHLKAISQVNIGFNYLLAV